MPKISVIVPVYRAEAFLHACVDGILSQTFSDFELFLVDDGSPDGSGAICDSYLAKDSRVRVIHQRNQGQAAARNHALAQAAGEWICYVDSDDLIHPQMLQRLFESAERNGAGISMCPMVEAPELPADFLDEPAEGEEPAPEEKPQEEADGEVEDMVNRNHWKYERPAPKKEEPEEKQEKNGFFHMFKGNK